MKLRSLLLAFLMLGSTHAQTLRLAAAADLRGALEKVQAAFERAHRGIRLETSYGASGTLSAQIRQGAPFDVFLAADLDYPVQLAKEHLASDPVFTYAVGHLALWVRKDLGIDPGPAGLAVLSNPKVKRVAIANPAVAPYGRAAMAALEHAGLHLDAKLLRAENVAQAAQYLQSGAADAGLISCTQAHHPSLMEIGLVWPVPASLHPPLLQGGLILKRSAQLQAARAFRDFLLGPEGRAILAQEGFTAP